MTQTSRIVLEDCKEALIGFKDGVQGSEWRRIWVTSVVLLRTVGHVLNKVDALSDPKLKTITDNEWSNLQHSKPEPKIFWEFINKERNNILKEYEINAGQGVTINLGTKQTIYHYKINSGYYQGREQKEVLNEAIDWWDQYLTNIETLLLRD